MNRYGDTSGRALPLARSTRSIAATSCRSNSQSGAVESSSGAHVQGFADVRAYLGRGLSRQGFPGPEIETAGTTEAFAFERLAGGHHGPLDLLPLP